MNIIIKKISLAEVDKLTPVFASTVRAAFPEYTEDVKKYFIDRIFPSESQKEKPRFGAYDENNLVGYLIAENQFGGVMFVNWLAILPDYQKRGIGSQLLSAVESFASANGVHSLQLQADERNIPFYTKNGFEIIGLDTKGYFGTDNYYLKKLIQEPNLTEILK